MTDTDTTMTEHPATDQPATESTTTDSTASNAGEPCIPEDLDLRVEAALLTADRPQTPAKLGQLLGPVGSKPINDAVAQLNAVYTDTGRSFRIEAVAGGWQIMTLGQYSHILAAMHRSRAQSRLTPAALETLAIVAYKQPVLRADVEAIRGVASGEMLRTLMDRRLVKIAGRAQVIGRPILYGTTKTFLQVFGMNNLKDLPKTEELQAPAASTSTAPPTDPPTATQTATPAPTSAAPETAPDTPSEPQSPDPGEPA